jgi:leucyl-tRNA synthetase
MYIGGAEHSVLHLLYSRFITMVLKDLKLINFEEPFAKFRAHGLLVKDGAKMSKSKGNVVIPDEYVKKFGADTLRTYLMFMGPYSQGGDFRDSGIEGMHRFLRRVWRLASENSKLKTQNSKLGNDSLRIMNLTIKKVTEDIENLSYNTAIAALMEYYNFLAKQKIVLREELRMLTRLIAPFMPHMAEEIWEQLGENFSVHKEEWPKVSKAALIEYEATIVVQINGKVRDVLRVTVKASKDQKIIEQLALKSDKVKKYLEGKKIKRIIYVEGKVLNFVVA